ncbi:MAG: hypothetical protein AAFY11_15985 [Cyanobacteria bacterium J06641_5]
MSFYIIRALFPAIAIDIFLTVNFLNRDRNLLGALVGVPLYLLGAFGWVVILGATDPRFSGQGAIGLALPIGVGIVLSVLRLVVGLILFITSKYG